MESQPQLPGRVEPYDRPVGTGIQDERQRPRVVHFDLNDDVPVRHFEWNRRRRRRLQRDSAPRLRRGERDQQNACEGRPCHERTPFGRATPRRRPFWTIGASTYVNS